MPHFINGSPSPENTARGAEALTRANVETISRMEAAAQQ